MPSNRRWRSDVNFNRQQHRYMQLQGEQTHITEAYVSVPPALVIVDERGVVWTLGFDMRPGPRGEYEFDVLTNGTKTGEYASRIERRDGKVRIFTRDGWKRWTGQSFF